MIRGFLASLLVSLILTGTTGWGADKSTITVANESEILRQGERMYREGILPSGEPMKATIRDDVQIPGNAFSCVSCHLRSGIGSMEGQILSPPTNGLKLYKPYYKYPPLLDPQYGRVKKGMWDAPVMNIVSRPAYTDKTLAEAILAGVDPNGTELNAAMPRYQLDDRNMDILITYLKQLSAEISPGVGKDYKSIKFATVIAGDVSEEESKEMMAVLDAIMKHHNRQGQIKNRYQNLGKEMRAAPFNYPVFSVVPWKLSGPPGTWKAQLEKYYSKEPVFALLGGLSSGDWQPMHEFSEQHQIPCLLPVTDLPVISDTDWYTLYFSKGIYQEGESAARYLALNLDSADDGSVLQVVEDSPRARALARGFQETWKELGRTAPASISLAAGELLNSAKLIEQRHPAAILLWTSSGTVRALEEMTADKAAPKRVHISATLLKNDLWKIPERAREITYISYPYRVDGESDFFSYDAKTWLKKRNIPVSDTRISTRLYALMNVLLDPFKVVKRDFNPAGMGAGRVIIEEQFETLMHVKRNYYRDYLLDVIGMFGDRPSLDYERFSFGPGQRYMSKGCYIAQLSSGPKPVLIKKSDWVIY